jgi:hypothetical protein
MKNFVGGKGRPPRSTPSTDKSGKGKSKGKAKG